MGFAELGQVLLQNNLNLKRRLRHANLKPLQSGLPAYTDYHDRDSLSASKFERRIKAADKQRIQRINSEYLILIAAVVVFLTLLAIILT